MNELRPTLWRTCRVIANETRLQLLWAIFEKEGLGVADLAAICGVNGDYASSQLRALSSRGLITPTRKKLKVIYRAEANPAAVYAEELLNALRTGHAEKMSLKTVFHQATGFTHERRIYVVRALAAGPADFESLQQRTGIAVPALWRHLKKLTARGYVKEKNRFYRLGNPRNSLGKALLKIACA
jgi:DNA-binding transcriptional ArsR family regulator